MSLKEKVSNQVAFMGKTPGGCKLVLRNLLDDGRDVFQFMQLFNEEAIEEFYYEYAVEIDQLCAEDQELGQMLGMREGTKLALEKTLIIIEGEIKNGNRN